jgi:hypothetical protein
MTASASQTRSRSWAVKRAPRRYEARWQIGDDPRRAAKGARDTTGTFAPFTTKRAAAAYASQQVEVLLDLDAHHAQQDRPATIDALFDTFLDGYAAGIGTRKGRPPDKGTVKAVRVRLVHARKTFGDRDPDSLTKLEIERWRLGVSQGMRHDAFRAFRQALRWAFDRDLMATDPSAGIYNPAPTKDERRQHHAFSDWSEVDAVAAEIDPRWAAIPIVLVGTALRPEELFGLYRSDVIYDHERRCGAFTGQRRYTKGELKEGLKTGAPSRRVPFGCTVYAALRSMPTRLDSEFLFTAPRGDPSIPNSSQHANGRPPSGPLGCLIGLCTRHGTPRLRGGSPQAFRLTPWPIGRARRSR